MNNSKPSLGSKILRVIPALSLILAGFLSAAGATYVLARVTGKPLVHFHNAHSNGKIGEGDAGFYAAEIFPPSLLCSGWRPPSSIGKSGSSETSPSECSALMPCSSWQ